MPQPDILSILMGMNKNVNEEEDKLKQLAAQPIRQAFLDPGQSGWEMLKNPNDAQSSSLLAAGLSMLGSDPRDPSKGMSEGIAAGFDLNNKIKQQTRNQGLEAQGIAAKNAGSELARAMDIMAATPQPTPPKTSWQTVGGQRQLRNNEDGSLIHNAGEVNTDSGLETQVIDIGGGQNALINSKDGTIIKTYGASGGGAGGGGNTAQTAKSVAESRDMEALSSKLVDIAFDDNLESVVGPWDPARLIPNTIYPGESGKLSRDIARYGSEAALPDIRKLAPVTDVDVALMKSIQLGYADPQSVWVEKTIKEKVPAAIRIIHDNLKAAGKSVKPANDLAVSTAGKMLHKIAKNSKLAGERTKETIQNILNLLPKIDSVDSLADLPSNALVGEEGRIYTPELIMNLAAAMKVDPEELAKTLKLHMVGIPND